MYWFGETWGAPVCEECEHISVPVGEHCAWCEEVITEKDQGVANPREAPFHIECFMRTMLGSLAHLQKKCSCYVPGSTAGDPPEMSKRQAALAALLFQEKGIFNNINTKKETNKKLQKERGTA
jgi:hypothetical protein